MFDAACSVELSYKNIATEPRSKQRRNSDLMLRGKRLTWSHRVYESSVLLASLQNTSSFLCASASLWQIFGFLSEVLSGGFIWTPKISDFYLDTHNKL